MVTMSNNRGSYFRAVDLHIHTPASHDYLDKKATASDIVTAALAKGLEVIAVTDHNSGEWVDPLRVAAQATTLCVIAGVEVTTPEGHIIGLFDSTHSSESIRDLLIRIGVPRERHGKEDAISIQHAEDVIRSVEAMGGVAIAAHANTKAIGLLQQKGQYKIGVVALPELRALEFTQREDLERFAAGKVSADYPAKACIQSSDAHSLAEMGSRITYLKMDDISVHGIRQALDDHDVRVRFPWNHMKPAHPRIVSLGVTQGFFAGQAFNFHDNLNCLVGGQGAGKSTVIEMLRYCFAAESGFEHILADHQGKIEALVGEGGVIEVSYIDSDGETKTVRREVHEWNTDREVHDLAGNDAEIVTPPAFFSQGELVDIARSSLAQLELLDRRLDMAKHDAAESDAINRIVTLTKALIADQEKMAAIDAEIGHSETGLEPTRKKHAQMKSTLADPVLNAFPNWEAEQGYLRSVTLALNELPGAFEACLDELDLDDLEGEGPEDAPNAKELRPVAKIGDDIAKLVEKAKADFRKGISAQQKLIGDVSARITPAFEAERRKHEEILKRLAQADISKATSQLRALATRLEALNKRSTERVKTRARIEKTLEARRSAIKKLRAVRVERASKRKAKAAEYQRALPDIIELDVRPLGDRESLFGSLRELSKGAMVKETDLTKVCHTYEPSRICELILADDASTIATDSGVSADVAARLVAKCREKGNAKVYELDALALGDVPVFRYIVSPGRSKPLAELSTGQKGTVIIALALVEGTGPLVVDHPEEPLDTKSIYGQVVSKLRQGKESRQFIFTTHNANIAVGADAELSHVLGATADKGSIEGSGGVDHEATNQLLLLHLEGGAEALARRVRKYRPAAR